MTPHGRALALLAATAALTLAGATTASAAKLFDTYWCESDACMAEVVGYAAEPGEANDVRLSLEGNKLRIEDPGVTIQPGTGPFTSSACSVDGTGHVALCDAKSGVIVDLGDGDDKLTVTGALGIHTEGDGGPGADTLAGGDGPEMLRGRDGNDALSGGGGDDELTGGAGDDDLSGGGGTDTASYADHTAAGVSATLDGLANDGSPGEADRLGPDIENLLGSPKDDTLVGDDGPNRFRGADAVTYGSDTYLGRGGDDVIDADDTNPHAFMPVLEDASSPDSIDCGDGNDTVFTDLADRPAGCETTHVCRVCKGPPREKPPGDPPTDEPRRPRPAQKPASGVDPRLVGVAKTGRRLTCRRGRWTGATSFRVRWLRNGKSIKGATELHYRLTRADRGKRISCRVTAKGAGGTTVEATRPLRVS